MPPHPVNSRGGVNIRDPAYAQVVSLRTSDPGSEPVQAFARRENLY